MRLKNVFLCLVIAAAAVFSFAGCSDTSVEDAALNQKIIGGWVPLNDDFYTADEDGNTLTFTVYEFAGDITKLHKVSADVIYSYLMNEYKIEDGKFKAIVDGGVAYAKIGFADNGDLLWYTDTETTEFRPVTQEEIDEFKIPIGQTLGFEPGVKEAEEQSLKDAETATDTSVDAGETTEQSSESAAE